MAGKLVKYAGLTGRDNQFAANVDHVTTYIVCTTQTAQADAVTVRDTTQRIPPGNDVLHTVPIGRNPGSRRRTGVEIILDAAGECPGHTLLKLFFGQAFSSPGLLMKAVSTSTEGTSGDLSTMKLARPTCGLCTLPVLFIALKISEATLLLASRVAL